MYLEQLARSFPASVPNIHADSLQTMIENHLPTWPRAQELSGWYLEQARWYFGPVSSRQLHEELLPMFYPEAAHQQQQQPLMAPAPGMGSPNPYQPQQIHPVQGMPQPQPYGGAQYPPQSVGTPASGTAPSQGSYPQV